MIPPAIPTNLLDLGRDRLTEWLTERDIAAYRSGQVLKWAYRHQADRFEDMTNIAKPIRELLAQHFRIARLTVRDKRVSADGACKYLFELADGERIEAVLIPERDHHTLCVSTQAGCAQNCAFCLTGKGRLRRNLTQGEILAQVRDIRLELPAPERLTNIVFMGMGEPLANYEHLLGALGLICDSDVGLGFAAKRVTVSTAGLVPQMLDLGRDSRASLAVSLNAADDETRSRLMPINRRYPLAVLLDACRRYPLPPGRRITFEYILIKGVNDSPDDARRLARLLHGVRCKVNLIPFNPHPGSELERPGEATVAAFRDILVARHYTAIVRYSKGLDILAACGQLRAEMNA